MRTSFHKGPLSKCFLFTRKWKAGISRVWRAVWLSSVSWRISVGGTRPNRGDQAAFFNWFLRSVDEGLIFYFNQTPCIVLIHWLDSWFNPDLFGPGKSYFDKLRNYSWKWYFPLLVFSMPRLIDDARLWTFVDTRFQYVDQDSNNSLTYFKSHCMILSKVKESTRHIWHKL